MSKLSIAEIAKIIQDRLFHVGEKQHLNSMKKHFTDKGNRFHGDFLSQVHDVPEKTAHQHQVEHNALNFWSYYFEGETPSLEKPLPPHLQDESWDEQLRMRSHTLSPRFTELNPREDGVGEELSAIERRWLQYNTLAKLALDKDRLDEAELNFRLALEKSAKLNTPGRRRALSAKGLAESLERQGKQDEADKSYAIAVAIDEKLLGEGDATLEDEFYQIAGHLIDDGKWREIEPMYADLIDRLRMSVGRNDRMMARCLNELGIGYCKQYKWNNAESLFAHALEILQEISPTPRKQLAAVYNNYAALCEATFRPDQAKEFYRKALDVLREQHTPAATEAKSVT